MESIGEDRSWLDERLGVAWTTKEAIGDSGMYRLTANTRIPRYELTRDTMGRRDVGFKAMVLERIARELVDRLMKTEGAVEIREYIEPATGDLVVEAQLVVANQERYGRGDMPMAMPPLRFVDDRLAPVPTEERRREIEQNMKAQLSIRSIEALKAALDAAPQPLAFLGDRINRKQTAAEAAINAAVESKARKDIAASTKKRGENAPVVQIAVRKITMPEEAE